jgi:hypothetical protein
MLFERHDIGRLFGMTGCLLSIMFILTIIVMGTAPPLQ